MKRPNLPCAGCGKLMWRNTGTLPEGQARCRSCRGHAEYGAGSRHGTNRRYKQGCRCGECVEGNARRMREYIARYRERTGESSGGRYRKPDWKRYPVPRQDRLAIYERDGWVCQLCFAPVDPALHFNHRFAATLDHIECQSWVLVPDQRPQNLRLVHRACNSRRRDGYGRAA